MTTAKQENEQLLALQPDDSTLEELIRELAIELMIQRGIADAEAGRIISNQEMRQRINHWRK
ncbi:MAG: hypothetical protein CMN28_04275 [Salinisphaeraceae bacterium]|jgi:predicted transcriptional regulator|nr:hypothetical protein [Salinisphaeraceae bacterium]